MASLVILHMGICFFLNFKEVDMRVSSSFGFLCFFWLLILRLHLGSIEDDKLYVGMGQSYSIMFVVFCGVSGVSNVLAMMYCKDV